MAGINDANITSGNTAPSRIFIAGVVAFVVDMRQMIVAIPTVRHTHRNVKKKTSHYHANFFLYEC